MFKNIISPVQAWLLSQGKCVGCGASLSGGRTEDFQNGSQKVTCKCGRVYIFDTAGKKFRRGRLDEA